MISSGLAVYSYIHENQKHPTVNMERKAVRKSQPVIPENDGVVTHWEIRLHGFYRQCLQKQNTVTE
jgi:hypothetical protein